MTIELVGAFIFFTYIFIPFSVKGRHIAGAIVVGVFLLALWPLMYKSYQLEKMGHGTVGILVDKTCTPSVKQRIKYKFTAEGREYVGIGAPGAGNKSCLTFGAGDQVFVTYLANDPNVNTPAREVDSGIFLGLFGFIVFYFFLIWANKSQADFKQRKAKLKNIEDS